ncbi:MAG: hypothetical protein K5662_09805 [Lachnospiraceae bacterium]|nr:hypothetical protein [Lachnospiraceae bacterium]
MVVGLDSFKNQFQGFEDCYTVIGGTACDILMSEANIEFRLTKDIDIILILEDRQAEFAKVFWEYIKTGGYRCGWKNSGDMHFYRFTNPSEGYPVMIELFSRKPGYHLEVEEGIIPIYIDDDTSSLSAILLNDDFYNFMLRGRRTVAGITVLGAEYLIPFKMYAWIDLRRRKAAGEHVNERDYKKHKNDVFRLYAIIDPDSHISVDGLVKESIRLFIDTVKDEPVRTEQLGINESMGEVLNIFEKMYS